MSAAAPSATSSGRALRAWQQQALAAYAAADPRDFLVSATPGAGKTTFALTLAQRLRSAGEVDRVVVVCPTDHLRRQWAESAAELGLPLDGELPNSVGPVRDDVAGYVATYAQVAQKPLLHRGRVDRRRTLVILDEVHHAGDGLTWGDAVAEAFDPARRRLALTGTPFRSRPDERIPFVRYEPATTDMGEAGLRSVPDYAYGYRQALADDVVRPVVFAAYTGTARWRNNAGEVVAASLSGQLTRSAEAQAWRTALNPRGRWVPHVIAAMDERITQLRGAGMTDAAGLVLASDQEDARAYARIVARVTGEEPELITSDDPKASARIGEFASSTQRIAVCVRMISEGVDVPRAACLAWLTSYRTPLFFAQAVGRVVRARRLPNRVRETATVFLPAVRPLLALAAELESERDHVVPVPPAAEGGLLDPLPRLERDASDVPQWEALDAEAEFAHVLAGGRAVVAPAAAPQPAASSSPLDWDDDGLPGLLSPEQTALLLSQRDRELRRRLAQPSPHPTPAPTTGPSAGEPSAIAAPALRREVNALVGRVAASTGQPHAAVHAKVRAAVPGPPSASASADLLARRRDHLLRLLRRP